MTVILAHGDRPTRGEALKLLQSAARVIECEVDIGDGDSGAPKIIDPDQETNDLEKAYKLALKDPNHGEIIVLGATGQREDHTLGNIFRCLEWGVDIVSDFGRFHYIKPSTPLHLYMAKKQGVSIFTPYPDAKMTSSGLEWPLDNVKFRNLYCATLNRATGPSVTVTSTRPAYLYLAYDI